MMQLTIPTPIASFDGEEVKLAEVIKLLIR